MNSNISVALPEDASSIHALVNSAYRGELSKAGWTTEADLFDGPRITLREVEKLLADANTKILKFVENGELLACVMVHPEDQKLYLGMLTVNPVLQGKGIGKILLKAAEDEAISQKLNVVFMTVITLRADLLKWYYRHGYADTGKRIPFDKEDARRNTARVELELAVLEKIILET